MSLLYSSLSEPTSGKSLRSHGSRVYVVPSKTDNRQWRSIKQTDDQKMVMRAVIERSPRAANQEADELANGMCTAFDPANQCHGISYPKLWKTVVLHKLRIR